MIEEKMTTVEAPGETGHLDIEKDARREDLRGRKGIYF